jgi:hypothetical protein
MYEDRENPSGPAIELMRRLQEPSEVGFTCEVFGRAGREYMEKYVVTLSFCTAIDNNS